MRGGDRLFGFLGVGERFLGGLRGLDCSLGGGVGDRFGSSGGFLGLGCGSLTLLQMFFRVNGGSLRLRLIGLQVQERVLLGMNFILRRFNEGRGRIAPGLGFAGRLHQRLRTLLIEFADGVGVPGQFLVGHMQRRFGRLQVALQLCDQLAERAGLLLGLLERFFQ